MLDPTKFDPTKYAPTKKVFSLVEEFKAFAFKGNVIDLAVGVMIGAAFGGIVQSLVKNVIMPAVNLIMPSTGSYTDLKWPPTDKGVPYGLFLGDVVNFIILALVLFIFVVKFLGFIMRSKQDAPPPPPTKQEELLTEIRDLLKSPRL